MSPPASAAQFRGAGHQNGDVEDAVVGFGLCQQPYSALDTAYVCDEDGTARRRSDALPAFARDLTPTTAPAAEALTTLLATFERATDDVAITALGRKMPGNRSVGR